MYPVSKKICCWLFILPFVIMFFTACNNNSNKDLLSTDLVQNPISADGTNNPDMLPVIEFEKNEETHDFGKILQGEVVTHFFKFKNTGKSNLIISSARASCGCTVPDYPKNPIPPGEGGQIEVSFNSADRRGIQTKTVTLVTNAQPNTKVLTIKAEIVVP